MRNVSTTHNFTRYIHLPKNKTVKCKDSLKVLRKICLTEALPTMEIKFSPHLWNNGNSDKGGMPI